MRISELIKELEKIYDKKGNLPVNAFTEENYYVNFHLEVGVGRINTTGDRVAYYSDIAISYSKDTYLYDNYDAETIDYYADTFCALD